MIYDDDDDDDTTTTTTNNNHHNNNHNNNNIYIYELKPESPGKCFLGRFWVGTNMEKNDMILFLFFFSKNPWIEVTNTWNRTINYLKWFEGNVCRTLLPTSHET